MLWGFNRAGVGALSLVLLPVIAGAPARAAQAERQLDCGVPVRNQAVVIAKVTLGDTEVFCHGVLPQNGPGPWQRAPAFMADDDWPQNLTIYLFNRTDKTIVWGMITLGFPQTGDGSTRATAMRTFELTLGRRPAIANLDRAGRPMPVEGAPLSFRGERALAVHLGDYISQIQHRISDVLPVPVTTISVISSMFIFEDGMRWSSGAQFAVPDQDSPGRWKPMPFGYFPGDVHANWPVKRIKLDRGQ